MKHSYIVYWEDEASSEEGGESGWYCQVSNFTPWGPFETQGEALESMMMEWPRFEEMFGVSCGASCSTGGCNSCQGGCCNV